MLDGVVVEEKPVPTSSCSQVLGLASFLAVDVVWHAPPFPRPDDNHRLLLQPKEDDG